MASQAKGPTVQGKNLLFQKFLIVKGLLHCFIVLHNNDKELENNSKALRNNGKALLCCISSFKQ